MDGLLRRRCLGVNIPGEERAEGKVLHDREFGQDLGVEHLDHALVDLAPAVLDPRHVVEDRAVLPEGALLDVVDEPDGGEVHVGLTEPLHGLGLEDVARFRRPLDGAFERHSLLLSDGAGVLCGTKDVRHEGVVV